MIEIYEGVDGLTIRDEAKGRSVVVDYKTADVTLYNDETGKPIALFNLFEPGKE